MEIHVDNLMPISKRCTDGPALVCPVCGFGYVSPVKAEIVSPGQKFGRITVDSHGIHLNPNHPPMGRGCVVFLGFQCESGHQLTYEFALKEGHTTTRLVARSLGDDRPEAIWRD